MARTAEQKLAELRAAYRKLLIDVQAEIDNQHRRTNGVRLDVIQRTVTAAREKFKEDVVTP